MQVAYQWMTNPTLIGTGARLELGQRAKELGMTNVFMVTDPGIESVGILTELTGFLEAEGIKVNIFAKVNSDPLDTMVEEGAALCKSLHCDGIIAIGGGSSMDAAKAMNVLINNPPPLYQYYGSWNYQKGLPLICMPTTSGTGSENTIYSVINCTQGTDAGMKKVILLTCELAICDPVLTYKLPKALTAATGLDAFAHCAESVTCNVENPLVEILAMDGISRVSKWLPVAYNEPTNVEAREQMLLAANLGGIAFSQTCCHLGHAISQQMGAKFHCPHGISCAWALPETMAYAAQGKPEKVRMIADFLNIPYEKDSSNTVLGQKVADGIRAFMRLLNVKSIKDYGISREDLVGIVDMVMADNCFPFIPTPLTRPEVKVILGKIYETYQ